MTTENHLSDAIERNIRLAMNPSGSPADVRERNRAAGFLVGQGEPAYRILLDLLKDRAEGFEAPRLIELIGFFKREDSVELLKSFLMQGKPGTARPAAMALASAQGNAAMQALKEGLSAPPETRVAAIDAVRITGDASFCPLLENAIGDPDPNIRYYAVNTAAALGCLDKQRLERIIDGDEDEDVRKLAGSWINKMAS
jgi:HEAT repeat protein